MDELNEEEFVAKAGGDPRAELDARVAVRCAKLVNQLVDEGHNFREILVSVLLWAGVTMYKMLGTAYTALIMSALMKKLSLMASLDAAPDDGMRH